MYIGDAVPDAKAMLGAYKIVVPADHSALLRQILREDYLDVIECPQNGGHGVIDWVASKLEEFES